MMRAIRPQNSSAPIIISIVLFGSYRYSQKGNFLMNNSFFSCVWEDSLSTSEKRKSFLISRNVSFRWERKRNKSVFFPQKYESSSIFFNQNDHNKGNHHLYSQITLESKWFYSIALQKANLFSFIPTKSS